MRAWIARTPPSSSPLVSLFVQSQEASRDDLHTRRLPSPPHSHIPHRERRKERRYTLALRGRGGPKPSVAPKYVVLNAGPRVPYAPGSKHLLLSTPSPLFLSTPSPLFLRLQHRSRTEARILISRWLWLPLFSQES